jgi:hypothetical protein
MIYHYAFSLASPSSILSPQSFINAQHIFYIYIQNEDSLTSHILYDQL